MASRDMIRAGKEGPCSSGGGLSGHPEISPEARLVTVSWMAELVEELELQRRTLFAAVATLDQFLQLSKVLLSSVGLLILLKRLVVR